MIELFDFQQFDIDAVRNRFRLGDRSVLYVAPTGTGKTHSTCSMIEQGVARGRTVAFVAHRRELIDQTSVRLDSFGINHGVLMGNHPRHDLSQKVQVCSIQTLARRGYLKDRLDLIVIDEAHHAASDQYVQLCDNNPRAWKLGLTATPCRLDGKGLGNLFNSMVVCSRTMRELIQAGRLVQPRVFAPGRPLLNDVKTTAGDYAIDQLQAAMDKPTITGDIVDHWLRLASGRRTIVFAAGVEHSKHIVERFIAAGVPAAHLDAKTPADERVDILRRLASGELWIVSNCGILTEGFDCPAVSCVILARPTQSVALYMQMVGRALRCFAGKDDCIILDHASCTRTHGWVTEDRDWDLERGVSRRRLKDDEENPSVSMCPKCYAAFDSKEQGRQCPYCGTDLPNQARSARSVSGELTELQEPESTYKIKQLSSNPQIRQLQQIAAANGYKPGWVYLQMQRIQRGQKPLIPQKARRPHGRDSSRKKMSDRTVSYTGRARMAAKHGGRLRTGRNERGLKGPQSSTNSLRGAGGRRHNGHWPGRRPHRD